MIWTIAILTAVLLLASVLRGAPYVPTHTKQVEIALDLLDLKTGDHLVDVGSGDGKVLLAGAKKGLKVTGYEINPMLCLVSWFRLRRFGNLGKVVWGDMWSRPLPIDTKGVFVFTMGRYMPRVREKILKEGLKNVKLASFGFELPGQELDDKKGAVFLYKIR